MVKLQIINVWSSSDQVKYLIEDPESEIFIPAIATLHPAGIIAADPLLIQGWALRQIGKTMDFMNQPGRTLNKRWEAIAVARNPMFKLALLIYRPTELF